MQVDGAGVHEVGGPGLVDRADQPARRRGRRSSPRPATRCAGRPAGWASPDPAHTARGLVAAVPPAHLTRSSPARRRTRRRRGRRARTGRRRGRQRPLVGGALEVGVEHVGVGRVDHRRLRRPREHLGGVAHQPLVELVVAGHEHGRPTSAVPRPARPACCHIEAMVPGNPVSTQASRPPTSTPSSSAEVATTPSQAPGEQRGLDLAPLLGQVAAAVGRGPVRRAGGAAAGARRRPPARCPCGSGRRRWCAGPRAMSAAASPAASPLADARRPVAVDQRAGSTGRRARRPGASRRRSPAPRRARTGPQASRSGSPMVAEVKTKVGEDAVVGAQPAQPAQQVGDVGAEDAPQHVQLVDHHVAQPGQERAQRSWWGRIPWWSISGLVSTTLAWLRTQVRSCRPASPS